MIDLHSHIVPEVDDRAHSLEAALDLLWRPPARILKDREFGQK